MKFSTVYGTIEKDFSMNATIYYFPIFFMILDLCSRLFLILKQACPKVTLLGVFGPQI
jgi:hypothetical protein